MWSPVANIPDPTPDIHTKQCTVYCMYNWLNTVPQNAFPSA